MFALIAQNDEKNVLGVAIRNERAEAKELLKEWAWEHELELTDLWEANEFWLEDKGHEGAVLHYEYKDRSEGTITYHIIEEDNDCPQLVKFIG